MVIPKKYLSVRTVDNLCELNKHIIRHQYTLPKIRDDFHHQKGYSFVILVGVTLWYYTCSIKEEITWLCVIVTPFGKFHNLRLTMGMTKSPDWVQGSLKEILGYLLQE